MIMARRILMFVLIILLLMLQVRLWFGDGSLRHHNALQHKIAELEEKNKELSDRNHLMAAEVADLKQAKNSVEEIARRDLGMIREGEVFYLVPELNPSTSDEAAP